MKLLCVYRTKTVGVRRVLRVAVSLVPKVITTHTHTDGRADASARRTKAAAIYDRGAFAVRLTHYINCDHT